MNSITKEVQENKDKINKNIENYLKKKRERNENYLKKKREEARDGVITLTTFLLSNKQYPFYKQNTELNR